MRDWLYIHNYAKQLSLPKQLACKVLTNISKKEMTNHDMQETLWHVDSLPHLEWLEINFTRTFAKHKLCAECR